MNITLWTVQLILAVIFLMAGTMKLTQPIEKFIEKDMDFVEGFSVDALYVIGTIEVLGAIGIILPALTGIFPLLTPIASVGLGLTMASAMLTHWSRREYPNVAFNIFLVTLTAFVAYRLKINTI